MNSREVCYFAIILIGYCMGLSIPFFVVLGISPFVFFLGFFLECMGKRKILTLFLLAFGFKILISFVWLNDFADSMINIFGMKHNSLVFVIGSYSLLLIQNLLLLFGTHRALKRIGVYNRIEL